MDKLLYLIVPLLLLLIACQNDNPLDSPTDISSIRAKADTGAVVVSWDMPPDSSYLYLKVSTKKYPDNPDSNQAISTNVSKYTDSVLVKGLLHKYNYTFKVQPFNANDDNKKAGKIFTTDPVQPIRRGIDTVYNVNMLTKVNVTTSEISESSVDPSGDTAANLLDGDISTFWQTNWTSPHEPPFWVQFDFNKKVSVGVCKYINRQFDGRGATQFGLAISNNGNNWKQVWTSQAGLPATPLANQFSLNFGKNYTAKHFRVLILQTVGGNGYIALSEIGLSTMKEDVIDGEDIAKENY